MLILKRAALMVPILFGIATVTFVVTRLAGGDPAYLIAGPRATEETIANLQRQLGTDRPLWEQYTDYVLGLLRGDLGESIFTGQSVTRDLADRLPATLILIVLALTVALIVGLAAGRYAGRRRGSGGDRAIRYSSFAALSMPDFWLGLVLVFVFFFHLGWAPPPIGQIAPGAEAPSTVTGAALVDALITFDLPALWAAIRQAWLPVMTMALVFAAPIARLARSATADAHNSEAILFARACGLPDSRIRRYATRMALPPVVTFVGILFSVLLGSAVLVETVFSWGGAAQYAVNAIRVNDFAAIQGFVLTAGAISIVIFLVVDILYTIIDPRVKL